MAVGELSFAFNPAAGETPETVKRKRMLAEAILGQASRAPKDVGEGLNAIGQALLYRKMMSDAGKGETAGASAASKIFQSLMGSNFPAPPPAATTASAADARADMSGGADSPSPAQQASYAPNGNEIRDGILSTAQALGIDPIDLGTAISYETAGTFDPMQKGPRTQWGQHKGLIQFGEPQAKQYGVDWSNPVGSQLGPDGAVAKYLRDTGVKPGMGMLDIYSAINAGGVGLYNRSDADNGGAPGTVRDKVEKQMAGHRAKALALLGDLSAPSPSPQGAVAAINAFAPVGDAASPQQVASLDPSIGMPAAAPEQPQQMAGLFMGTPQDLIASRTTDISPPPGASAKQRIASLLMSPQSMTGGAPMPIQGTAPAEMAPQQQVAQAMTGDDPGAGPWGASLSQADAATRAGPSMDQLMQAASDPWVAQKYGGIIEALLQQKLKASDPLTQLQIEKAKRELAAPPERKTVVVNGRLVDAQTGQEIANFPDQQTSERKTIVINGRLVDAQTGQEIANFPDSQKPIEKWQKLDDNTLYDPATGETKNIGGEAGGVDLFKGSSVEAQSLNGLVRSGQLTPDQAMQLGAGKTITDPSTGAIIFLTPQGVFGQSANGGQPQPVGAPPPAAAPQMTPPPVPGAGATPDAPVAPAATNAPRPGQIPLTDGKGAKPPTEQMIRNQQLYSVVEPEVGIVDQNFAALTQLGSQLGGATPELINGFMTSPEYQRASNSMKTIIATYLYSTSGATANPGEVANQASVLMPKPGESAESVADKLRRVHTMVDAIRIASGQKDTPAPGATPPPPATAAPDNGAPATPKTDEEYNALPSGALFVDPDDGKTYRKP